jgi:hypothetical protein
MVGFQHPPQHTQFKKGQSGNPKGRPKKRDVGLGGARSANALALKEAERMVKVREGEEVREIPAIEAVYRAQLKSATSGSPYAQRDIITRYELAEQERRERIREDCEFWNAYIERQREAIADAAANGQPQPTPLPHPDDIVIDYEKGVSFSGPIDEEQTHHLQEYFKQREILLMQHALDERSDRYAKSVDPLDGPGSALLYIFWLDRFLFERFRLSDEEIQRRLNHYARMPKRTLVRDLHRARRTMGISWARGETFSPLRRGKQ